MYQKMRSHTHHCQTHHRANLIRLMTEKKRDKKKNNRKRTKQDSSDSSPSGYDLSDESDYKSKIRDNNKDHKKKETGTYQIMHKINGKFDDDSV